MKKILQFHLRKGTGRLILCLSLCLLVQGVFGQTDFISINSADNRDTNYLNDAKLDVHLRNAGVAELLEELGQKSSLHFVFDKTVLQYDKVFTLVETQITLKDLLEKISRQSQLRFKQVNRNINVRLQKPDPVSVETQQNSDLEVTGKVIDSEGLPLPGVTVNVLDSSIGTVTDIEGNYSISVPEGATLVFSFIGMKPHRVIVGSQSTIDVTLMEDISSLEEVVVVGYGTQKRSDITGSVGVVGSKEFEDEPIVQVGQALQGKVAGVQVSQNSGAPGSALLIRVRGSGTVNNAEPLYVVDGNPNSNPIDLVPEQIESIQVLKSASAAAIYGAQGANGVILITTKQGRSGKSQLDVNFSQGFQQIQRNVPMTNAMEYATLYNEGLENAGAEPIYPDPASLGEGTDWQKEVFQVAPMTNVSVSASGGSASSRYFFSAGYTNQEGIVKGSSFDRINMRINSSHDINNVISIGQNLSASLSTYKQISEFNFGSILGSTLTANPEVPVRMQDGGWGYSETSLNSTNPLASIYYTNNDTKRPVINGNVFVDLNLAEGLEFRSQFNFNLGFSENIVFNPEYYISSQSFNEVANLSENSTRFTEYSWANTVSYNKTLGRHKFDLLGGVTSQESNSKYVSAYGAGLPANATENPNLRHLDLATQSNRVSGNAGSYGILSFLGRVNYNYDEKYFATVNFRADGSSRFGENNKFGYFPSFSLGWKLSEEEFLNDKAWLNNLMIRAGYGSLGNQNSLPNYAFANLVSPNINYVFGDPQLVYRGQAPLGAGNPNLKWESTTETNVGLDFMGFEGKITASFDWYRKETSDMLLQVPVAGYSGIQNSPYVNGGNVLNQGFEIMLGYENTTENGLNYSISGNLARNRNEVLDLSNAGSSLYQFISFVGLVNVTEVGSPIASFWGWQTDGIFQSQEEIDNHAFQSSGTAPGDFRFKDLNDDGVVNAEDQTIIGNPWPKITYGINGSISYKGFAFRLELQGVAGNDILMAMKFRTEGANFFNYTRNVWENRWTGPGSSNDMPRLNTDDPNNNMRSSEYYLEDGSYMRIRNVQLTYNFPPELFKLRNLSAYLSVQNAYTFTKYPGFDPEIGTNRASNPLYIGIDETNYPVPRIYTIGLKIGL